MTRASLRRRSPLFLLAAALLALAALFVAPDAEPAQAQNVRDHFGSFSGWRSTLTPKDFPGGAKGCEDLITGFECSTFLTPREFSYGTSWFVGRNADGSRRYLNVKETYTVKHLSSASSGLDLRLNKAVTGTFSHNGAAATNSQIRSTAGGRRNLDSNLMSPDLVTQTYVLIVDGVGFPLTEAVMTDESGDAQLRWTNLRGLSLTADAPITVNLVRQDIPGCLGATSNRRASLNPTNVTLHPTLFGLTASWDVGDTAGRAVVEPNVRWRQVGESGWLNWLGSAGEFPGTPRVFGQFGKSGPGLYSNHYFVHGGLPADAEHEFQVRLLAYRGDSRHIPDGQRGGYGGSTTGDCIYSEWVSARWRVPVDFTTAAPGAVTLTQSGPLREGETIRVFMTLDQSFATDDRDGRYGSGPNAKAGPGSFTTPRWPAAIKTAVVYVTVPQDTVDNNCRTVYAEFHVPGVPTSVDLTVIDDDGAPDTACTGLLGSGVAKNLNMEVSDVLGRRDSLIVNVRSRLDRPVVGSRPSVLTVSKNAGTTAADATYDVMNTRIVFMGIEPAFRTRIFIKSAADDNDVIVLDAANTHPPLTGSITLNVGDLRDRVPTEIPLNNRGLITVRDLYNDETRFGCRGEEELKCGKLTNSEPSPTFTHGGVTYRITEVQFDSRHNTFIVSFDRTLPADLLQRGRFQPGGNFGLQLDFADATANQNNNELKWSGVNPGWAKVRGSNPNWPYYIADLDLLILPAMQGYDPSSEPQGYPSSDLQGGDPSDLQGYDPSELQGYEPSLMESCASQMPANALSAATVREWRDEHPDNAPHVRRWNEVLAAFGEEVPAGVTAMTLAESRANERRWTPARWTRVTATLEALETCRAAAANRQPAQPANNAPTVASAISDATIVHASGARSVSLSGVFSDADSDALTITATSSNTAVATASVSSDHATLTVTARSRGTATITVTADDGNGGTVSDDFTVTVKAAPRVASAIPDQSLTVNTFNSITLSEVFSDADGDALTYTVESSDDIAVSAVEAYGDLSVIGGFNPGSATVTVTARDSDGNTVSDAFRVTVAAAQPPANNAPTVASALADATIVHASGTHSVSLSGVFSDADSDSLTITASSSNTAVATASVSSDYSTLTVSARSRGTATITVTANDGNGGTVSDVFTVTVKAAPTVAQPISDVSGLEVGASREISLAGVFRDADGDRLTITAASSNDAAATVTVASDRSRLTVSGQAAGTATITVTARDSDGNRVSDSFVVAVAAQASAEPEQSDIVARYDANGDGKISQAEWIRALMDFSAGTLSYAELMEVAEVYKRSY